MSAPETLRQRAKAWRDQWHLYSEDNQIDSLTRLLEEVVGEAIMRNAGLCDRMVRAEREECAKLADEYGGDAYMGCDIAEKIRERSRSERPAPEREP